MAHSCVASGEKEMIKMPMTPQQETEYRKQGWTKMTLEQAIAFGYESTLVEWANGMAQGEFLPRGFPYARAKDIPQKYLERMGVIVTTPEKAIEVKG
jgi:hypothetical protein